MPQALTETIDWIARQRLSLHEAALLLEAVDNAIEHHGRAAEDAHFHIEHAIEEARFQHEQLMSRDAGSHNMTRMVGSFSFCEQAGEVA